MKKTKGATNYADVNTGNREKPRNASFAWDASNIRNPCNTGKSRGKSFSGSLFMFASR
jgi:hypothetical protein